LFSKLASGISLDSESYLRDLQKRGSRRNSGAGCFPTYDEANGEAVFFLVNRDEKSSLTVELDVADANLTQVADVKLLHHKTQSWQHVGETHTVGPLTAGRGGRR